MRVLVTGGTGFIGSHTVAELVRGGHEVRLLVRAPERVSRALVPLGVEGCAHAVGDVTDDASVEHAMEGCDAVVHCASVFSLDSRERSRIRRTNVMGTEVVIGTAHRLGLDPIVHVSSMAALFPPDGQVLTTRSPVKHPPGTYYRSKADSERVARRYQETGAPVVITYPSVVFGAHDPHFGEVPTLLASILKGRVPAIPPGGFPMVDVASVARVHAAVMSRGRGPRRYMVSGTYVALGEAIEVLGELTGRRIHFATMPHWSLWPAARLADAVQRFLPFRIPLSLEAFYLTTWDPHCDDSETRSELGVVYKGVRDMLAETVEWMARTGRLSAAEAGALAG